MNNPSGSYVGISRSPLLMKIQPPQPPVPCVAINIFRTIVYGSYDEPIDKKHCIVGERIKKLFVSVREFETGTLG